MSRLTLSDVQKKITDPDSSVWVSASAGTGKTFVLTLRVMRLLLSGVKPDGILCLTYTKAAAAEMRSRILDRLREWAVMDEGVLREELAALDCFDIDKARRLFAEILESDGGIKIQTIHGFCQSLLKSFPLEANLPPYFEVIEGQMSSALMQQAMHIMINNLQMPENAMKLRTMAFDAMSYLALMRGDEDIRKVIAAIAAQKHRLDKWVEHHGGVDAALASIRKSLSLHASLTEQDLLDEMHSCDEHKKEILKKVAEVLYEHGSPKDDKWFASGINEYLSGDKQDCLGVLLTDKGTVRSVWYKNKALSNHFPEGLAFMASEAERVMECIARHKTLKCAIASENINILALTVLEIYRYLKMHGGLVDYGDMLEAAHKLLTDDNHMWVLYRLDSRIEHLLIDEAQDTSHMQWEIVNALIADFFSGESMSEARRSLFVVGDYKQSIYSFQGAEPDEFIKMRREIGTRAIASGNEWINEDLGTSFRSSAAVIDVVDEVFAISDAKAGVSESDIKHLIHRNGHAGRVECWPLVPKNSNEKLDLWEVADYQEPEDSSLEMAIKVATHVKDWLDKGRILPAKGRAVEAGDIMILLKQRPVFSWLLRRELRKAGVPVAAADRLVLQDDIVAEDLLALADWLLLPQDDMVLASILKSPICNMNEDNLFALCHNRGDRRLWDVLRDGPEYKSIADMLAGFLARADHVMPYELFHSILTDDIKDRFVARIGEAALEVMAEFLNMCIAYESKYAASLQGFVRWMRLASDEIKNEQSSNSNEVRVMTVHSSKGLQAPIVILPDAARTGKFMDTLFWAGDGIESPLLWQPSKKDFGNDFVNSIYEKEKSRDADENRRLMYVALTRAEDEIYVGGWGNPDKIPEGSWYSYIRSALEKIGHEEEGSLIYSVEQTVPVKSGGLSKQAEKEPRPSWFDAEITADEISARTKPSANDEVKHRGDGDRARELGIIEHKLLQVLPKIDRHNWKKIASDLVGEVLNAADLADMLKRVESVVDSEDLSFIFGADSLAEVPVSGIVDGAFINGQIDRLIISKDKILIVDFKTSKSVPESIATVPNVYKRQMLIYSELIKQIYKNHKIEAALLWTSSARLMYV